jgi:hypothetical protein
MAVASRTVLTAEQVSRNLAESRKRDRPAAETPKVLRISGRQRLRRDRFESVNTFVDVALRHLGGADAKVWLVIWRDTRQGVATVSNKELGLRTGHDERTVRRSVRTLVESGWLEVVKRGGINRGASVYRVLVGSTIHKG